MRHLENIDVLDGGGDIALTHAASVQGKHLAFNGRDITLVLLDDLRLEGALTVTGHVDGDFFQGRLESLSEYPLRVLPLESVRSWLAHSRDDFASPL